MTTSRRAFLQLSGAAAAGSLVPRLHSQATDASQKALRRKLASDRLRPQYHLLPASNWMNDPNGPIFFRGRYHMFHQYNPEAAVWGSMNWAHATSPDLIHWQHEPIAISPTPGSPARDVTSSRAPSVSTKGRIPWRRSALDRKLTGPVAAARAGAPAPRAAVPAAHTRSGR